MTWFRIDDDWLMHSKVQKAGPLGRQLWIAAGVMCARADTDGHVDGALVPMYAGMMGVPDGGAATSALIASGLWHDHETIAACRTCVEAAGRPIAAGDYYFHDWLDRQLAKKGKRDKVARDRDMRRRALYADLKLVAAIRERDRDRCRYCDRSVVLFTADHKSAASGTFDHVDPWGDNTLDNVVVACRRCNGQKKERTPEEWAAAGGRPLRPPPSSASQPIRSVHDRIGSDRIDGEHGSTADLDSASLETGPGRIGPGGTGTAPDANRIGTDPGPEDRLAS